MIGARNNSLGESGAPEFGGIVQAVIFLCNRPEKVRQAADLPEIREPKKAMKRSPGNYRCPLATPVVAICFFLLGCATEPAPLPTVTHVVLMWLKHPGSGGDRAQLIRAAHSLRMIPGVTRVEATRTLPALPPGVEHNFDLGVVITFRDRFALQRYEKDPRHLEAMRRYLRPLVRRYEVYNLSGR
jgi:hypothetical protein